MDRKGRVMMTPEEKYLHDPDYKLFVDAIKGQLHRARYTPSEVREMCMLACIMYERERPGGPFEITESALRSLRYNVEPYLESERRKLGEDEYRKGYEQIPTPTWDGVKRQHDGKRTDS
jgi:hypothetical protein